MSRDKPTKVGYARVSTDVQSLERQSYELRRAGCRHVYTDRVSGRKSDRPGLARAFEKLRTGDTLVVVSLDRLGRSLSDLLGILNKLQAKDSHFMCLNLNINTSTPTGKLLFSIIGAVAEFEAELIRERVKSGLASARRKGRVGGRSSVKSILNGKNVYLLARTQGMSEREACKKIGMDRSCYSRNKEKIRQSLYQEGLIDIEGEIIEGNARSTIY